VTEKRASLRHAARAPCLRGLALADPVSPNRPGRKDRILGLSVEQRCRAREGFVVGMRAMPGNPCNGHTLREALEQVEILTDTRPRRAFVDRRHGVETADVFISGQRRGMTPALGATRDVAAPSSPP
jgi:hypothetical protein